RLLRRRRLRRAAREGDEHQSEPRHPRSLLLPHLHVSSPEGGPSARAGSGEGERTSRGRRRNEAAEKHASWPPTSPRAPESRRPTVVVKASRVAVCRLAANPLLRFRSSPCLDACATGSWFQGASAHGAASA